MGIAIILVIISLHLNNLIMESSMAFSDSIKSCRKHKYSTAQLAEIEAIFKEFSVHSLLDLKDEAIESSCKRFLGAGSDDKVTI